MPNCALYRQATQLHKRGIHLVSTDEKTGIQALPHKYPVKPVRVGQVARLEHEYDRQGTLSLIANFEVATGRIVAPSVGPRRTEADFLAHIQQTVAQAPQDPWLFIVDNLNTHQSASLVEWVAQQCGIEVDLGVKDSHGILKSMASRAAFLADPAIGSALSIPPSIPPGSIKSRFGLAPWLGACSNAPVSTPSRSCIRR